MGLIKILNILEESKQTPEKIEIVKQNTEIKGEYVKKCLNGYEVIIIDNKIYYDGEVDNWDDIKGVKCEEWKRFSINRNNDFNCYSYVNAIYSITRSF